MDCNEDKFSFMETVLLFATRSPMRDRTNYCQLQNAIRN